MRERPAPAEALDQEMGIRLCHPVDNLGVGSGGPIMKCGVCQTDLRIRELDH